MFIIASQRTDIAAYYSKWFMNRIREGFVYSRNPLFPNKVSKYQLNPNVVDCIIFCTKNPEPMLKYLSELFKRGYCVYFYVTITSYGKDIEPMVPDYQEVIRSFQKLSSVISKNNISWRYDPVLITPKYTIDHHLYYFEKMTVELAPYTNSCIFSFVQMYKKLGYTFPELRAVTLEEKKLLLSGMGEISRKFNMQLQTCGDKNDYTPYGIACSGCITVPLLEKATGKKLKSLKPHPVRSGCGCIPTNDIGLYHTCPNGCRYCYATKDHMLAKENFSKHDPTSPLLLGALQPDDILSESRQKSYAIDTSQLTLNLY